MTPHIQETVAHAANKVTAAGSATTMLSWATSNDFGVWAGIAIGLAGLLVNFYYKRKNDRRAAELHRLYMSKHAYKAAIDTLPPIQDPDHLPEESGKSA